MYKNVKTTGFLERLPPVLQLGDRGLRMPSQAVADPTGPAVQRLIAQLIATAEAKAGVGIAAPQLGVPWRLFLVMSRPNLRYPTAPTMAPTALINPTVTAVSDEQQLGWEGCLSVPGWRGYVPRARQVEVDYVDPQGQHHRRVFTDFIARIIQHESDHLEGTLLLDRVEHTDHLLTEAGYQAHLSRG